MHPIPNHMLFPPIADPDAVRLQNSRSRMFVVEADSNYLPVPGCLDLEALLVDGVAADLDIDEDYPIGPEADFSRANQLVTVNVPLFRLQTVMGVPSILRSVKSNHGVWAKGSRVIVVGEWADDAPGSSVQTPVDSSTTPIDGQSSATDSATNDHQEGEQ